MQVRIDDQDMPFDVAQVKTMPDLVEYIKANIDPDTIITQLTINDRELSDIDWRMPLSVQGDCVLEVRTGTRDEYLSDRFSSSVVYIEHISNEFSFARSCFQEGNVNDGNAAMATAVNNFDAFLGWYNSLMQMLPDDWQSHAKAFSVTVQDISKTCEQLLQQQLYQSWWALGETIKTELEPKLGDLRESCESFSDQWDQGNGNVANS